MPKVTMIRISQKSLDIETLNDLFSALEGESVTIKRLFDSRYTYSGDDLIIEGEIDKVLEKLSKENLRIISIKFQSEDFDENLESKSALSIQHGETKIFFGTTLVDYEFLFSRLRINDKNKILSLFFKSQLGGQFLSIMPVKIKGMVVVDKNSKTTEFILPSQRIETLRNWLDLFTIKQKIDFDILVDIFRKTDPNMRKKMEEAMNWVNTQLPELVAKSVDIENIDFVRAYQNTLNLI